MSDIDTGTSQRDVDKIIDEALKAWEKYGFKDMSLWETFQEDFEGFTEEDFKLASNYNIRRLRDYLRKFGVWIRKQQRYTIARSLYEALLEEVPTDWTEEELMACKDKEDFASFQISRLIDFDFGRKTQISTSGPRPAATPSAFCVLPAPAPVRASTILPSTTPFIPAPFASSSASPTPLGEAPVSTSSASPSPTSVNASTILPSTTTFALPPTPPTGTGPSPAVATTSTDYSTRELPNLAKISTGETKYSGRDDSFTFKLVIFHDTYTKADVPPEAKMMAFSTMLKGLALDYYYSNISISGIAMNFDQVCYSIRMRWMRWDPQDGMDETRIGVG